MTHAIPGLTDDTSLDTRNPPPDLGPGIGRLESTTIHQSEVGAAPGLRVDVTTPDGVVRGWRINYSTDIKSKKFGPIETKRLFVAAKGLELDDPRGLAYTAAQVAEMVSPAQPCKGAWIRFEAMDSEKINPRTGKPYRNVRVLGPATAPAGFVAPAAPTSGASAPAAAAAPPPPPPPPPAAPSGPPAGWYEFPAGDPRAATHYYNATGIRAK